MEKANEGDGRGSKDGTKSGKDSVGCAKPENNSVNRPPEEEGLQENEYYVERVRGHRVKNPSSAGGFPKTEFLIVWAHYPGMDEWRMEFDLGCPKLVLDYWKEVCTKEKTVEDYKCRRVLYELSEGSGVTWNHTTHFEHYQKCIQKKVLKLFAQSRNDWEVSRDVVARLLNKVGRTLSLPSTTVEVENDRDGVVLDEDINSFIHTTPPVSERVSNALTAKYKCKCVDGCGARCECARLNARMKNRRNIEVSFAFCGPSCGCGGVCDNSGDFLRKTRPSVLIKRHPNAFWMASVGEAVKAGEVVMVVVGEMFPLTSVIDRVRTYGMEVALSKWLPLSDSSGSHRYVLDPTVRGNAAKYIQHSCSPNLSTMVVHHAGCMPALYLVARKAIGPGEDLTANLFPSLKTNYMLQESIASTGRPTFTLKCNCDAEKDCVENIAKLNGTFWKQCCPEKGRRSGV